MGRKTRNPNSDVVVMVATIPPRPTLGCFQMTEMPVTRTFSGLSPVVESGVLPWLSLTKMRAINPPNATITSDSQRVLYVPITGTVALASSAPSVGRPPVRADQNQPTAVPRYRCGVTAVTQTRNP